jgi:hypothetical protein
VRWRDLVKATVPEALPSALRLRQVALEGLVALSLAFLVWVYLHCRDQESLDNVPVPVQIALAPAQAGQYDLEVHGPSQVPVSFTGPPSRIRELRGLLQRGEIQVAVTLAVPEERQGECRCLDTVRVDAADVHAPPGVTPLLVEGRNRIAVTLHRLAERRLPVRLDYAAEDRPGKVRVEPATVLVRGPQDVLDRLRAVSTRRYTPPTPPEPGSLQEAVVVDHVPLAQQVEGRPLRCTPAAVTVRLTLPPRQKVYELNDVPVKFLCPPNFTLRPRFCDERAGKVSLRLRGPAAEEPPAVVAFIDVSAAKFQPGSFYADEPVQLQLPRDYQLDPNQPAPRSAKFQLVPLEDAPVHPGPAPGTFGR